MLPTCLFTTADATIPTDIARVVENVVLTWGRVDILVNNVGGGGRWGTRLEETGDQVWIETHTKNVMAAVRFTRHVLPLMAANRWGRVVTIASVYGKEAGGAPWFTMAKSAEIALMKTLALDRRYKGITFNTVAPGPIRVGNPAEEEGVRYGNPQDVAAVVAFLCSEQAKWVNGACIVVDGGESRSF
jgi:3-oxoacyl-[acyl-carrier protein] reductase